ncbi:hypothetical protein [[Actinomadura] parvosata]|uniref:hypothetical protein n=1 Tax=[Actinomadura] parvosata TaxID=1955412 RepID=UPI00164893AE
MEGAYGVVEVGEGAGGEVAVPAAVGEQAEAEGGVGGEGAGGLVGGHVQGFEHFGGGFERAVVARHDVPVDEAGRVRCHDARVGPLLVPEVQCALPGPDERQKVVVRVRGGGAGLGEVDEGQECL